MIQRRFIIYLIFVIYMKKYKTNIFEPKLEREIFDHIYLFYEKNNIDNHEKKLETFYSINKKIFNIINMNFKEFIKA